MRANNLSATTESRYQSDVYGPSYSRDSWEGFQRDFIEYLTPENELPESVVQNRRRISFMFDMGTIFADGPHGMWSLADDLRSWNGSAQGDSTLAAGSEGYSLIPSMQYQFAGELYAFGAGNISASPLSIRYVFSNKNKMEPEQAHVLYGVSLKDAEALAAQGKMLGMGAMILIGQKYAEQAGVSVDEAKVRKIHALVPKHDIKALHSDKARRDKLNISKSDLRIAARNLKRAADLGRAPSLSVHQTRVMRSIRGSHLLFGSAKARR